jgi:hypothetical protein
MALTLKQTQSISRLSKHIYDFLPGNPHPYADKAISFAGVAVELRLDEFWRGGSKLPAINALLESTLNLKREMFCPLMLEIVRRGIKYRSNKGNPITEEEVRILNGLLFDTGFKIPELWNEFFLESLPGKREQATSKKEIDVNQLKSLMDGFMFLQNLQPKLKGFEFERLLNRIFDFFGLHPRSPFRLQGEQIDGSLELEGQTYLIEAKFQKELVGQEDLLVFRAKVEAKSTWSRGIFISASDFTQDGLIAFSKGRPTNLIAFNGQDIYFVLTGKIGLEEVIKLKTRRAAETGEAMVPVYQLILEQPPSLDSN